MATVAFILAGILAALLVVRELTWRAASARLRERVDANRVQMREQEQLAHVSQLVSGLAQELKSPLQGVIGNAELMLASDGLNAASQTELRDIQASATRAADIVRNLLAFTETTSLTRRWEDMNELASRAVESLRSELDASGVRVNLSLADRLPLLYVDGRQLEKVMATLLSRPTPRSTPRRETAAVTVATRLGEPDGRLIIELDDHTASNLDELDEPIWSGDLVACRQIVHAHGGSLEVERPANGGYRFHLELPVTAAGVDAQQTALPT
jgi:two-component system, NtrC family, sensor kinase